MIKTETRGQTNPVVVAACEFCGAFCSAEGGSIRHTRSCESGLKSEFWTPAIVAAPVVQPKHTKPYVLTNVDGDVLELSVAGLEEFCRLSGFDAETREKLFDMPAGSTYRGGGGAAPTWTLERKIAKTTVAPSARDPRTIDGGLPLNTVGNGEAEDKWHAVNSRNAKDWNRAMNRDD